MPLEVGEIYDLRQHGKEWFDIAILANESMDAIKARYYKWQKQIQAEPSLSQYLAPDPVNELLQIPASQAATTNPEDQPLILQFPGNSVSAICIGDLHVPHQNSLMLMRAIKLARLYGIKTCILGGDLFDFASLSSYSHNHPEHDPNDTVRLAGQVLRALLQSFDRAVICNGNHDERFSRKLDRSFDLQLLINAALGRDWPSCQIQVTNLDYVYLGDSWIVGHPSHYSGIPGKTPGDLADMYARHTITFHNHISGLGHSKSGRYIAIDAGHCTMPSEHYYMQRRMTKFARWTAGFVIIRDNYPTLYNELVTDWQDIDR